MNKISRRQFLRTGVAAGMLSAAVVSGTTSASACYKPELSLTCTQIPVVEGYDWGPGVKATILAFNRVLAPRSIRAEDILSVVEHKESMDWANIGGPHIVASAPRTRYRSLPLHQGRQKAGGTLPVSLPGDALRPQHRQPLLLRFSGGHEQLVQAL